MADCLPRKAGLIIPWVFISLGIHWCWVLFGIAWAPRITSFLCPNLHNCLTSKLPPISIQSHRDVMMLKFLKNMLLLKWPSTLNKSSSLKKVRLGGSSVHAADHLTWWDKTRRDPLRGGETKPYRRLQKFTQHYEALRFQGSGKGRVLGLGGPQGGTFGAFWGFSLIGPWQAGGQGCPQSPQSWFCISKGWGIPTIAIFMSIILDTSGAIVVYFFL